ncbi:hypothetical protein QH73_0018410 [Scytonema millei VB511283]|uniref:Uncharacterized protein n=1 Tax=Scytonema millei VB511283 TaxID=1245923 RepID=A0A9X5E742_9CYAN|nr:hypothetical protein [Scytonema millei VB511283]
MEDLTGVTDVAFKKVSSEQLSVISYQLSVISYQLSVNRQPSTVNRQPSTRACSAAFTVNH